MTATADIKKQAAKFLAWRAKQEPDVYAVMTAEPETSLLRKRRHNKSLVPTEEWIQRKAWARDSICVREAMPKRMRATRLQLKGGW